jgi:hypothetical protein
MSVPVFRGVDLREPDERDLATSFSPQAELYSESQYSQSALPEPPENANSIAI